MGGEMRQVYGFSMAIDASGGAFFHVARPRHQQAFLEAHELACYCRWVFRLLRL